jgi:hypothetical protein
MLGTISESVFSRAAHFILELLQNAEDAGAKAPGHSGEIDFYVAPEYIQVTHNGAPFTEDDVNSICGVRSKKKPEQGTLGFLGIGFKSVFRVTDRPQIHSGDFHFKFDKASWANPSDEPWQITPIWIDNPSGDIDRRLTTFILPFRSPDVYEQTLQGLSKLDVHVFLFLKWLQRLRVRDEATGGSTTIENLGGYGNNIVLSKDGTSHKFVIFRRASSVPAVVAADPSLEFYKRQNVKQREVVLAFGLDDQGNLKPIEDASALGSVSSFLPLVEERSGAKFLVQSDFLVQPGREAIQYELPWNHWLVTEAAMVAKEAIDEFKQHPKWRSQFLSVFDFQAYWGQAAFERLFHPTLHVPLDEYLKTSDVLPTRSGEHVTLEQGVLADEHSKELLGDSDLPMLYDGRTDLRLANRGVDADSIPFALRSFVKSVDVSHIARSAQLLEAKLKERRFPEWFSRLYTSMAQTDQDFKAERRRDSRGRYYSYESPIYVLTDQSTVAPANLVYLRDIPRDVLQLRERFEDVDRLLASYQLIHPELSSPVLDKFFADRTHVRPIDYDQVCRDVFLPRLALATQAPPKDELIAYTRLLQQGPPVFEHMWVMTKAGVPRPSNQVFLGAAYFPSEDWELNAKYCPQLDFRAKNTCKASRKPICLPGGNSSR